MAAAVPAVTSTAPGTSRPRFAASDGGRAGTTNGIAMSRATPSWSDRRAGRRDPGCYRSGDPAGALARLVASWQLVHQFRNILLAAQRELPAERIRGVHDRILRRVQSLIEQGQRAGTFRRDMPQQWLITTTYSLMHAAAEDTAAGRLDPATRPA